MVSLRVQTREALKAVAHCSIKGHSSIVMLVRRHNSGRKHHFGETGTVAQQSQGNLRVWQLPNSLKQLACFGDAILCVLVAEGRVPHRSAEQLKVLVPYVFEVSRKS